jgi:hypothetical protein
MPFLIQKFKRRTLNNKGGRVSLLTAKDLRLFIQTQLVFVLAITHVAMWNLWPGPDIYVLAGEFKSKFKNNSIPLVLNMEWVLVCALMPWLNIFMSSDIRLSLLRLLSFSSKKFGSKTISPITVFAYNNKNVSINNSTR